VKSTFIFLLAGALACAAAPLACSSEPDAPASADAGPVISLGDSGFFDAPALDGNKTMVDGGFAGPDGGVIRADRFATAVTTFTPGDCAGFGVPQMPAVVLGPPVGSGAFSGGLDVVSLGFKGEVVLAFDTNAIVDGPGADFIVFENAFWAGGDPKKPTAELAEVSQRFMTAKDDKEREAIQKRLMELSREQQRLQGDGSRVFVVDDGPAEVEVSPPTRAR